ncbi:unnamed protein product, partial [Iphiclides podalirius]
MVRRTWCGHAAASAVPRMGTPVRGSTAASHKASANWIDDGVDTRLGSGADNYESSLEIARSRADTSDAADGIAAECGSQITSRGTDRPPGYEGLLRIPAPIREQRLGSAWMLPNVPQMRNYQL